MCTVVYFQDDAIFAHNNIYISAQMKSYWQHLQYGTVLISPGLTSTDQEVDQDKNHHLPNQPAHERHMDIRITV